MPRLPLPRLDSTVPAVVLKVGYYPVHHGGLAVVRTLGRAGVPVYSVCEDRFSPAGMSRYTTGRFVWRTGGEDTYQDQLLEGLGSIANCVGSRSVLIPTDDHAAIFMAEQTSMLQRWFVLPRQSASLVRQVTDKAVLYERCRTLGVPIPETVAVTNARQLELFADTARLPVVAKRSASLLASGRRARSTEVIHDRQALLRLAPSLPTLLQEHIPSGESEDWLFHAYCDAASRCLVAFTGRKLRAFPAEAGETALGRCEPNPILEEQAKALLRQLEFSGVVSLDYRFDRRDRSYKLLDFNPRMGAIFRLFTTTSGVDVIRALHLDLTGRAVPPGQPVYGRVVLVEGNDVRSSWRQFRQKRLSLTEYWSSLRTVNETAWLARDDLAPAVVAFVRGVSAAIAGRRAQSVTVSGLQQPRFLPGPRSGTGHW